MRNVNTQFASTMAKYKKRKGMKYRELSEATGITSSHLCDILKGRKKCCLTKALSISKALDFSLDDMKGLL